MILSAIDSVSISRFDIKVTYQSTLTLHTCHFDVNDLSAEMVKYPKPLEHGARIAVTAPSWGVSLAFHEKLNNALNCLHEQGFEVIEGKCLRDHRKSVSAPTNVRAAELMHFLVSEKIDAIFPPCGGDLAIELLPLIDFSSLADVAPKWVLGFSDISTILLPLTLLAGWATAHGELLLGRYGSRTDPLTLGIDNILRTQCGAITEQASSAEYQPIDYTVSPPGSGVWTQTRWKVFGPDPDTEIVIEGRIIGGCLDRIARLAGTKYGNIPKFIADNAQDGVILFLESGMWPTELARTLIALRMNGWFDSISGLIFGRNSGADANEPEAFSYMDALQSALGGVKFPVILDADIGHQPPQLTLIQGALTKIIVSDGKGVIFQRLG